MSKAKKDPDLNRCCINIAHDFEHELSSSEHSSNIEILDSNSNFISKIKSALEFIEKCKFST